MPWRQTVPVILILACGVSLAAGAVADVPNHAVVLIYHHVDADTPPVTSVSPELFLAHLRALAEGGHRVLPLTAIVDSLRWRRPLPDRTVGLSFDDGYVSVYRVAFPLLRERGWPFTVFVCPAAIDAGSGPVMGWDALREMAAAGATIANHGLHHRHLQRRRDGETGADWRQRVRTELLAAQARIEVEIGVAPPLLAYPYGEYDPALQAVVAELGWAAFGQQSGACGEQSDLTLLPRFPMAGAHAALAQFGPKVASLPLPVRDVQPAAPQVSWPAAPQERRPELSFALPEGRTWRLSAFSGDGTPVPVVPQNGALQRFGVRTEEPLGPGRSRYNVTAPFGDGTRFYWFSRVWIVGDRHRN